jgi:hypothetical protein
VLTVSNPRDKYPLIRRQTLLSRISFAMMAAVVFGALVAIAPVTPAAAASAPSEIIIKWDGDTSSAREFQPNGGVRDPAGKHYSDFRNLTVKVSQTKDLIDQAIRVTVSGFNGATRSAVPEVQASANYVQAMQCYGANPNAADFVKTCQWGGFLQPQAGNAVPIDNRYRVSLKDLTPAPRTDFDNPFVPAGGAAAVSAKQRFNSKGETVDPILSLFGPSTTNEVPLARVGSNGSGYFDFETQSSSQAPHLGCGTASQLRCWLVIVPRGTKFGGGIGGADPTDCSYLQDLRGNDYRYGDASRIQGGSPVNPKCDYFNNRIVVPLDFTPTAVSCPSGRPEFRVSGSQFMIAAMSSWQPTLCQNVGSTFSFATNPDGIARAQLNENTASSPGIVYSGYPVSSAELETVDERTRFAKTALDYVPVAVSSVVVAFNAEFANGREEGLVLTPRLLAKLLTQSYSFTVPSSTANPRESLAHLSEKARSYAYWNDDPDFRNANPTNWQKYNQQFPAIVLPGPSAADGIKQVWRWILADSDAVAFLNGTADPYGMKVNPYYLPKTPTNTIPWYYDGTMIYTPTPTTRVVGQVSIDGAPLQLSTTALDTFPKDDGSLIPFVPATNQSRFDSIQFAPYAIDYLAAARQTFRGDANSRIFWDSGRLNDGAAPGAYISTGVQDAGSRFLISVTDSANAARYGLTTASLTPANTTVAVQPTPEAMAAALTALTPTSLATVLQVDPSKVTGAAYPLTMVTYAGVNLTKSTPASRETISKMLKQVTTTGQVQGTALGDLPVGYVPLSTALTTQASTAIGRIQVWTPPTTTTNSGNTNSSNFGSNQTYSVEDAYVDPTAVAEGADPTVTTGADQLSDERTPTSSAGLLNSSLAIALIVGLLGFLFAPFILRGRGLL